ncbi:PAAR domain-containing protein [Caldimonas manganoxidans]|uniref:PAAR domain-containing protein n=1 Tax=Caldimonas manganoxidans TaxID=196015 RepID=UPI002873ADEE|nr:PAAR domain-containing protein [Caldimonas manganoxidans]
MKTVAWISVTSAGLSRCAASGQPPSVSVKHPVERWESCSSVRGEFSCDRKADIALVTAIHDACESTVHEPFVRKDVLRPHTLGSDTLDRHQGYNRSNRIETPPIPPLDAAGHVSSPGLHRLALAAASTGATGCCTSPCCRWPSTGRTPAAPLVAFTGEWGAVCPCYRRETAGGSLTVHGTQGHMQPLARRVFRGPRIQQRSNRNDEPSLRGHRPGTRHGSRDIAIINVYLKLLASMSAAASSRARRRNMTHDSDLDGRPPMRIDGKPAARHGDKCACGATLIASQSFSTTA